MKKAVVVTGAAGCIGSEIVSTFSQQGYFVIGIDKNEITNHHANLKIQYDLVKLTKDPLELQRFYETITQHLDHHDVALTCLINNAAVQILEPLDQIDLENFYLSFDCNVVVPLCLTRTLLPQLTEAKGVVINIGSIHARQTKPAFVSYATSKSALAGLTRAMAVDLAGRVRVTCIEPAAIKTEMLLEGFAGDLEMLESLKKYHPTGTIGNPEEVAEFCYFLAESKTPFLNGESIALDGGIGCRLHDPA
ncbi:Aklaviketone reductase DauE [BD1-7 clade bacterium]|uniref:Aklaviketone reductase DauE n=1 Tax=BD1-7 clade bacterium TaxID=2029982 RepID=A0A5S9QYK6_9GAMM|nr:Aklaviketone reductase DauE [BD1-7 clade bacterium]